MRHTKVEVQHWNDVNCLTSAISILRLALGYRTPFPAKLKRQESIDGNIPWLLENAGKLFPNHEVFTCGDTHFRYQAHNYSEDMVEFIRTEGDFVWIYGFTTQQHFLDRWITGRKPENHTVIGLPVIYEGMSPIYAIKIRVDKEKAKE